jgi:adenylosuccinate synthase
VDYFDRDYQGVREYDKLSPEMKSFIDEVEKKVEVPVTLISTGPDLEDTIDLREEKL